MKIVIDIPETAYKYFAQDLRYRDDVEMAIMAIVDGTPLPDGAEILTKEAYSDLCMRAANVPENARKRMKTHACVCISRQADGFCLDESAGIL